MKKFLVLTTALLIATPVHTLDKPTVTTYFQHLIGDIQDPELCKLINNYITTIVQQTSKISSASLGTGIFMEKFRQFLIQIMTEEYGNGGVTNPADLAQRTTDTLLNAIAYKYSTPWQSIHPMSINEPMFKTYTTPGLLAETGGYAVRTRGQVPTHRGPSLSTEQLIFALTSLSTACQKIGTACDTLAMYLKADDYGTIISHMVSCLILKK